MIPSINLFSVNDVLKNIDDFDRKSAVQKTALLKEVQPSEHPAIVKFNKQVREFFQYNAKGFLVFRQSQMPTSLHLNTLNSIVRRIASLLQEANSHMFMKRIEEKDKEFVVGVFFHEISVIYVDSRLEIGGTSTVFKVLLLQRGQYLGMKKAVPGKEAMVLAENEILKKIHQHGIVERIIPPPFGVINIPACAETQNSPYVAILLKLYDLDLFQYLVTYRKELTPDSCLKLSLEVISLWLSVYDIGRHHGDFKLENILVDIGAGKMVNTDCNSIEIIQKSSEYYADIHNTSGNTHVNDHADWDLPQSLSSLYEVIKKHDVFSLGIALYEIFTGHDPYDNEDDLVEETHALDCDALYNVCPQIFAATILSMLNHDPKHRPTVDQIRKWRQSF